MLDQDKITEKHLGREYFKYEITINFSKNLVKEEKKDRNFLEIELKTLEKKPKLFSNKSVLRRM